MNKLEFGFERIDERDVPELSAVAVRYRHRTTGADFLSVQNDDENKVFGITFQTVPEDCTGIAHILEHSVLCGSEKYPVKEPFVELLKGSLKSFLNAFTFPDKTCYPVASPNTQDLYNLMDVYLDAVFHPHLTPMVLRQEGWHFHLEQPDGPMRIQGVVYNEMKGAYSSPESLLAETSQQSLFPHTPYALDSGGDPRHIPDLTWEAFQAFHRRHYHPSNALIFMCGDDPPDERLRRLDAVLRPFDAQPRLPAIPVEPPFPEPREFRRGFCSDPDDPGADKGLAAVNWVLPDPLDPTRTLIVEALAHLLMGTSASPVRKALIDSGLGEGLAAAGVETHLRQMMLSAGLRGIRPADAPRMTAVILDTLETLVRDGLDRDLVEASVNTVEFALRENNCGSFPRGLALMLRALPGWLHGADPIDQIAFEGSLQALKTRAAKPGFFESLIRSHLLENPHRTTVILEPDPALAERMTTDEQARIGNARASLRADDLRRLVEETTALQAAQDQPDDPADLARIPTLSVEDLPRTHSRIPQRIDRTHPQSIMHPLPTHGIAYVSIGFNLRLVRTELLPLVPIFCRALFETGTRAQDFISLSRRIGRETGGLGASTLTPTVLADGRASPWFIVGGKALTGNAAAMADIIRDVFESARIDDRERIRQMVLEAKAAIEAGLPGGGMHYVIQRLAASLEESAWIGERMKGISALFALRALVQQIDADWPAARDQLMELRDALLTPGAGFLSLTADEPDLPALRDLFLELAIGDGASTPRAWPGPERTGHEAMTLPMQVNHMGLCCRLTDVGYAFHGAALLASRLLSTGWLWDRVRVRGGAYGAVCRFSQGTGVCAMGSYRDPNVAATLKVFRESPAWLRTAARDAEGLRKAIIGLIGEFDAPKLPDAKGREALTRRLTGCDDATLDRMRRQVLDTTPENIDQFADALEAALPNAIVAGLGNPEALAELDDAVDGPILKTAVLRE